MTVVLLGLNLLLFALWVWAIVDCTRTMRNYWWLTATITAPLFLYAGAIAYVLNFKLLPALGKQPVDEAIATRRRINHLTAIAAERGLAADWLELATLHYAAQRWEDCLRALRHVLDGEPDNLEAHLRAGTCLLRIGKIQPAIDHLDYVCNDSPHYAKGDAATRLGEALAASGDDAGAERWFRTVLKRVPLAEPSVRLAELLASKGDPANADEVLARAWEASQHWSPGEVRAQGTWPARLKAAAHARGIAK